MSIYKCAYICVPSMQTQICQQGRKSKLALFTFTPKFTLSLVLLVFVKGKYIHLVVQLEN